MMLAFRKSYEIVGWSADADLWCNDCAHRAYGVSPDSAAVERDSEGNEVSPVFLDQASSQDTCGQCHVVLMEA